MPPGPQVHVIPRNHQEPFRPVQAVQGRRSPSAGGQALLLRSPVTTDGPMTKARGEVLVVDDDAGFRAVIGEVLLAEGCSVREAANGREAFGCCVTTCRTSSWWTS